MAHYLHHHLVTLDVPASQTCPICLSVCADRDQLPTFERLRDFHSVRFMKLQRERERERKTFHRTVIWSHTYWQIKATDSLISLFGGHFWNELYITNSLHCRGEELYRQRWKRNLPENTDWIMQTVFLLATHFNGALTSTPACCAAVTLRL